MKQIVDKVRRKHVVCLQLDRQKDGKTDRQRNDRQRQLQKPLNKEF